MRFIICLLTFLFTKVDCLCTNSTQINRRHLSALENITTVQYIMNISRTTNNNYKSQHGRQNHAEDSIQCKSTRAGLDYAGFMSHSFTGQQCLPWTIINNANTASMLQPADTNYCRNPDYTCTVLYVFVVLILV